MARNVRKQIKQPDVFQSRGVQALAWTQSHTKPILLAAAAVLLAGVAVWGYRYWSAKTQEKAAVSYMLAQEAKGPQELEALRRTALTYPKTRAGIQARLELGAKLRERGDLQAAEQEYRIVLASAAIIPMDKELAQRGLAAILEAQGKCDEAIGIWREILGRGSLISQEDLYLSISACQEKAGKPQEAAKTLEEFSQKFPQSPFLNEIYRERMNRLAGPAAKSGPSGKPNPATPPNR
jgi:predicted negative regulator of RcsB-dependent stress response